MEDFTKLSAPLKICRMRDDVCNLYRELEPSKDFVPDSFLSQQLKTQASKKSNSSSSSIISEGIVHLRCALLSNFDMLKKLTEKINIVGNAPSSADFAVLESSVVYTSFLISMLTTSGTDFLSAIIPKEKTREDRKRKGSSATADSYDDDASEDSADSEIYELDDDDDDTKSECISRFHEICEDLGAAPIHPDWLDTSCSLRAGIGKSAVVEMAESALRVLTEFGSIVYDRYLHSLNILFAEESAEKNKCRLPLNVVNGMVHGEASSGWHEHIGELCTIDSKIVSLIESGLSCRNLSMVKEAWTPYSAHRIRGKLQSTMAMNGWPVTSPELRAGGEWEILLSDALLGSCSDIEQKNLNVNVSTRNRFHQILRWRRVLHSIINATTTATALLRFSLNDGKGRTLHHLNEYNPSQDCKDKWYQSSPISRFPSYGDFSMVGITASQLDTSVCKSLCLLSDIQSSGVVPVDCQLSAKAATNHLVGSNNDMQLLLELKKVRNFLLGLLELLEFAHDKDVGDLNSSANAVLEKLIQPDNIASDEMFLKALLLSLGSPVDLTITTLQKPDHGLKLILKNEFRRNLVARWEWGLAQHSSIEMIVHIVQGLIPVGVTRLKVVRLMKDILVTEETMHGSDGAVKLLLLQQWNKCAKSTFSNMVLRDICLHTLDSSNADQIKENVPLDISRDLTFITAHLSCTQGGKAEDSLETSKFIFDILKANAKHWMVDDKLDHVLFLFYLLAAYHGALGEVGVDLLNDFGNKLGNERRLCLIEMFYRFLCGE